MADERQELDRLRKLKRLRELEAKQGGQNDISSTPLVNPSVGGLDSQPVQQRAEPVTQEKGFFDQVGEFFSGSERETAATREFPEIGQGGLLFGEDEATAAAITPALLTATNPEEMAQILQSNFKSIGIQSDKKGNLIAANNKTGARVVLNKPGISQIDILQGLGIAAAFTPAGRAVGALRVAGTAGATSAGVEALQALSGGEFDATQVVIDTVTAGVLDKAFEVAKATGRSIRNVLRDDANIDPTQLLKSFEPQGTASKKFSKKPIKQGDIPKTVQQATQADLTPEALKKIRQAERQGVQLTKAQATGDFAASEAEQTLLKSVSPEGIQSRQFADQQQEQLKGAAKAFTDKFGGSARLTEASGELADITARDKGSVIQAELLDIKEFGRKEVTDLYKLAGESTGDALPLSKDSIVDVADEIIVNRPITPEVEKSLNTALAKFGLIGDSVEQSSRNKFKVTDGTDVITITGDVTPLTLNNAEDFRQALNKAVGADQTGSAKIVVNALDEQVNSMIKEGADSGRTGVFKQAREAFASEKGKFSAKDIVEDLTSFKRGTATPKVDPETVINKIAKGDKAVTNIRKIKKILLENPTDSSKRAWRSIQAETVGDILSQAINKDTLEISGARLNSAMKKYKPEALRELLGKKQFAELKRLQQTIGDATIAPPGTTNPSGTFTKLLNMTERLGNFAGAGQFNFGSLAIATAKKGKELAARKKTLDGIVNTKIQTLKANNPTMSRSSLEKAAKALAFLEIRELDKENK
ncbi:MAG: hypothetical protein HRU18_14205 [Pseudoalteromonas sp.]|uniref:hypothetical protein n=1 Tax=Pseudoalteromonas sp. TaxID=53249 RepID=UPI001D84785D|nr:hypothetical protein [Pseudoalteromonas sp.]NRA79357.1 hypothetical protein [Pseudoalteromonas sp.]